MGLLSALKSMMGHKQDAAAPASTDQAMPAAPTPTDMPAQPASPAPMPESPASDQSNNTQTPAA